MYPSNKPNIQPAKTSNTCLHPLPTQSWGWRRGAVWGWGWQSPGRNGARRWRKREHSLPNRSLYPGTQKNNGGTSNSWPPSILSQIQRQRPIMQNRFYRKAQGGWGGNGIIHVRCFFFFFFNPIRDLIIISLLAEKPNKWQEKEYQLNVNTHTLTHTKMKDLLSFKAAANFPSFKRLSEKDTDNECAFSTGSLINFFPFRLPPQN